MKFTDGKGREWTLRLDYHGVRRCRAAGADPLALVGDEGVYAKVAADPLLLVELVAVVLEPELAAAGVEADDLKASLCGDCLEAAETAFFEALADFSPARGAKLIKAINLRARTEAVNLTDQAMTALASIDLSGDSPDSSASTPAPSASAS